MSSRSSARLAGSARDAILARVREALRRAAPAPHVAANEALPGSPAPSRRSLAVLPLEAARPWLPDGGNTPEESLALFAANCEKLKTSLHRVSDSAAAASLLRSIVTERKWSRVACHSSAIVGPMAGAIDCERYCIDAPSPGHPRFDKQLLESCDAGVTLCESLVAQTGSILVSSATCGGRALSILPHVHIVLAHAGQIQPTLGDALAAAQARHRGRMPSMLGFITGPSRTGDIERILVLGAHGPKELIVIVRDCD